MKIDNSTLWQTFCLIEPHIKADDLQQVKDNAPAAVIGKGGYYALTIAQWHAITAGRIEDVFGEKIKDPLQLTAYEYYTITGLKAFAENYVKQLERFSVKSDTNEQAAQAVCFKVTMTEGLLIFAREYFGLHSFAEAEQITLADLLLAKKDTYNKTMFQKAYTAQMQRKKR